MNPCPRCRRPIAAESRFCAHCGSSLESDATQALGSEGADDATIPSPVPSASASSVPGPDTDSGAFAPGQVIADRYRVIAMLGRGGMGEVFRADDLTLGQSVALKFLPADFAAHADRRSRFYAEVRTARQVAHANVCRVYDIGEVDGRVFLSMEYIDGEDLASLLRRIGRLPQEKAIEIARQLCAGLGALHDRGILHRDLKPANVMIDGRGRVRITDFGLASAAAQIRPGDMRAGTPAYMAPEQLAGKHVDEKSDLYALGLLLYEIFTGKRALDAGSLAELKEMHQSATPISVSSVLSDVDPTVERVIERCLSKDPSERPPSALAVAAALPGGDPLAAALAAGEIPSMEMVAAAGKRGGIRPALGVACVLAVIAAILVTTLINSRIRTFRADPMEKPPAVLLDRARTLVQELGYDEPRDFAFGLWPNRDVARWVRREDESMDRWQKLRESRAGAVFFWYRQSPRPMIPESMQGVVLPDDPDRSLPGMVNLSLDTSGRLLTLHVVPGELDSTVARVETDWDALLAFADFDVGSLTEVSPAWVPRDFADERRAWTGPLPGDEDVEVRIEAAAFRGRPVSFSLRGPWSQTVQEQDANEEDLVDRIVTIVILSALIVILAAGVFLAVRNVRLGRGDQRGALRVAIFVSVITLVTWALSASHPADLNAEMNLFLTGSAWSIFAGLLLFSFYLALEPYVRKTNPDQLVAWGRVLTGRYRDPLVGRDVLFGGLFFLALTAIDAFQILAFERLAVPPHSATSQQWESFLGPHMAFASVLAAKISALFNAMFLLLTILLVRLVCRKEWITILTMGVLMGLLFSITSTGEERIVQGLRGFMMGSLWALVIFRVGLLAFIVGFFFARLVSSFPVTLDPSQWYAGNGFLALGVIVAVTLYGLYTALAGKALFRDEV